MNLSHKIGMSDNCKQVSLSRLVSHLMYMNTAAIVRDLQQPETTILDQDFYGSCFSINGVLEQLLLLENKLRIIVC